MRRTIAKLHPALRGLLGLVTAGLMVLIGAVVLDDGQGSRPWIASLFFLLAAYRAFEALRDLYAGLSPPVDEDEDADTDAAET